MFEKTFTLKHTIMNCRKQFLEYSEREEHFGVSWNLELKNRNGYLSALLYCNKKADEHNWSIDIDIKMCLTSGQGTYRQESYQFVGAHARGWPQFHDWGSVIQNHTVEDCISVVCHVNIKNMRGFGFKRKINFEEKKENWADIVLKVGQQNFNVNKAMLAFRSPYFNTLFFKDFVESKKSIIELEDVNPDDFQSLLDVIHGESSVLMAENVEGVLKLADQFDVSMVRDKCEKFLKYTGGVEKRTKLRLADEYKLEKLMIECIQSITSAEELKLCSPTDCNGLQQSTLAALYKKSLAFL